MSVLGYQIGSKVRLNKDLKTTYCDYKKGLRGEVLTVDPAWLYVRFENGISMVVEYVYIEPCYEGVGKRVIIDNRSEYDKIVCNQILGG